MKTSVYISTDMVKVIAYTKAGSHISVKEYFSHSLPEECMLNGVILDNTPILAALQSLKSEKPRLFKETSLVIDGNFVYSKKITIPYKLTKLMCDDIIRDEFAEISSDSENLICDYTELSNNPDGSKNILACAVESTHVQAYISLFSAAKIKLTSIHLGMLAVLNYVNSISELKNKPFVLNVVDNVVMLSMIFQNGENVFQSRTRLYGDDRSSVIDSTLDGLSGIIQFNSSQNFQNLTDCYYIGFDDADMSHIVKNTSYPNISFSRLNIYKNTKKTDLLPPDAHFVYLNTLIPDSKFDLITNMKMLKKAKQRKRPKNVWIPVLSGAALFLIAITAIIWVMGRNVERDVRELSSFLDNPLTISERSRIDEFNENTARISILYDSVVNMQNDTESMYAINRQTLDEMVRIAGESVNINSINFNYSKRTVSLSCSSLTEYDASSFVESLRANQLFADFDVYYTGYATGANGLYTFSIDVVVSG